MNILIHGILSQGSAVIPLIETDKAGLSVEWQTGEYSDYCAITVTPSTMATTIAKVGTISWIGNPLPASGTGNYSFRIRATQDNTTGSPRSGTLRITDDASQASSVDVIITQQPQPI